MMFGLDYIKLAAIGLVLAALVGVGVKINNAAVERTDNKWIAANAARETRDHAAMLASTQAFIDSEMANNARIRELEGKTYDLGKKIDGDTIAFGRIAADGLYDRKGRPTGKLDQCAVAAAAGPAGDPPAPAAGCQLSEDLSLLLRTESLRADQAAKYGLIGHQYAVIIQKWLDEHKVTLGAAP